MDYRRIDSPPPKAGEASLIFETVNYCKEIEELSYKFYSSLGMGSKDPDAAAFWLRNAEEVWELANFWDKAIALAGKGLLPQIFDHPEHVRTELINIIGKMTEIISEIDLCLKDDTFAMTMSFKIEFYSIHRFLVPLVNLMKAMGGDRKCPYDTVSERLDGFLTMFKARRHVIKPEMQLLAETIQRLWKDNLQLSRECYFDELTSLLNRRGLYNAVIPLLNLAKRRISHVAMIVIDVDNFKRINDTLGHDAGDDALIKIASAIKNSVRDSDISARYGGDEFIVFCPEVKIGTASIVAEKIRRNVEACNCNGHRLTISAGAAEIIPGVEENCNEELASMFKIADSLLFEAKREGRNRIVCQTNPKHHVKPSIAEILP